MKLIHIYINALRLPKKQARIFLNKTTLTDTLMYLFSLVIIINLPGFLNVFSGNTEADGLFIVQYLILGPFFAAFSILAGISIISSVLVGIAMMARRKLKYQYLWKMAAFSLPLPILFAFFADILLNKDWFTSVIFLVVFFIIHIKMIMDFPKRKHK
ncbi:hypothetical protein ACOJQI_10545 [Bacillus salacetis]|uniref:hypothetical protein n=1 Tax=Bacillus salacetis TaxID=2315464 RepID=UPI003BA14AA3